MRTRTAFVLSAIVLLCSTAAFAADRRVHRTADLSPNGRLSLNTHNGTVTITTWNQPRVDVDAVIEPAMLMHPEDVNAVEIQVSGSGSDVRVDTNYDAIPERHNWFGGTNRELPPVRYTISVPAGTSIDIEDHNADVHVTGVQGDVRINAHNGSIDLSQIGGAASISAHNADVRVAFSRFARPSDIETHNGEIDIRMPAAARFNVNAHGHHLDVNSDFPVVASQLGRDEYVGNVNGGGPELRLTTHNGSVRLKRS
jgi:putative adhesin